MSALLPLWSTDLMPTSTFLSFPWRINASNTSPRSDFTLCRDVSAALYKCCLPGNILLLQVERPAIEQDLCTLHPALDHRQVRHVAPVFKASLHQRCMTFAVATVDDVRTAIDFQELLHLVRTRLVAHVNQRSNAVIVLDLEVQTTVFQQKRGILIVRAVLYRRRVRLSSLERV